MIEPANQSFLVCDYCNVSMVRTEAGSLLNCTQCLSNLKPHKPFYSAFIPVSIFETSIDLTNPALNLVKAFEQSIELTDLLNYEKLFWTKKFP